MAAGEFTVEALLDDDIARAAAIVAVYADTPLGFVDASLAAMVERLRARMDASMWGATLQLLVAATGHTRCACIPPPASHRFRSRETVFNPGITTARSILPSLSRSPLATAIGSPLK